MSLKKDKNVLKQYFRSGQRPNQKEFHDLIDNCYNYNETFTTFVTGYHVLIDQQNISFSSIKREAGNTIFIPDFPRINTDKPLIYYYHYAIPLSNLDSDFILERIVLDLQLPPGTHQYSVRDENNDKKITQKVKLDYIKVFNGAEEIYTFSPETEGMSLDQEFLINKGSSQWKGIAIDIAVVYDIQSNVAVSNQFNISTAEGSRLQHTFGSAGCIFKPNE